METRNPKIDLDALWQKSLVRVTDEFTLPPIVLTLSGITTFLNPVWANANEPIFVNPVPNVTFRKAPIPSNAYSGIDAMPFPKTKFVMLTQP